jgi:hypothetical protein
MSTFQNLTSDFPTFDQKLSTDRLGDFTRSMNLTSDGNLLTNLPDLKERVDKMSIPGHDQETIARIEGHFMQNVTDYIKQSQMLTSMNDLVNINSFVQDNMDKEYLRSNQLRNNTFNNVHKTRQYYMLRKYDIEYNKFLTKIIMFSFFVAIVCALIWCTTLDADIKLNAKLAIAVISLVLAVYLLILVLLIKDMMLRRKDDWNKYYYGPSMNANGASGSCNK